jgi:hypothetical protein
MTNYVQVLQANYVGSEWAINNNDDYDSLQWFSDTPKPTQAELDALWPATEEAEAKSACKSQAVALLQATDWTTIPDVADPAVSTPYLMNQAAFAAYRSQVRALAVNPVANPVFPAQPNEEWSQP